LIALNKPFQVLCQFRDAEGRRTLADFVSQPNVYAAGRLDFDSEGLLLLSGDGELIHALTAPGAKLVKHYWAQVEGVVTEEAIAQLERGVLLKDGMTAPARARRITEPPGLWARVPPIRTRKNSPTSWIDLGITEGKNRQVRRMTAAVGFPTLRLVRYRVGPWRLGMAPLEDMLPGHSRELAFPEEWLTSRAAEPRRSGPRSTQPRSTQPRSTQPRSTQPRSTQPRSTQPRSTQPRSTRRRATSRRSRSPK
jgi:23S rRNA pseudouridine2457 synthase